MKTENLNWCKGFFLSLPPLHTQKSIRLEITRLDNNANYAREGIYFRFFNGTKTTQRRFLLLLFCSWNKIDFDAIQQYVLIFLFACILYHTFTQKKKCASRICYIFFVFIGMLLFSNISEIFCFFFFVRFNLHLFVVSSVSCPTFSVYFTPNTNHRRNNEISKYFVKSSKRISTPNSDWVVVFEEIVVG